MHFKILRALACLNLGLFLGVSRSQAAASITLADYAFNTDGDVVAPPAPVPGNVNDAGFDYTSGLGILEMSVKTPGAHYLGLFVDPEIDEAINTFFNEYGQPVNTPSAVQSWEIDEPGFSFGDIFQNFQASALDNSSGVPSSAPDDVSMAMAWNLNLNPGQQAIVTFLLSATTPSSGFYLEQIDPDSQAAIYFSSSVQFHGRPVPEGGPTILMLLAGLVSLAFIARRK